MQTRIFFVATLLGVCVTSFVDGALIPGNLVAVRVGDGSAALGSAATATFLDQYTVAGSSAGSLALPTSASGASFALTLAGSATSEGFLALSTDKQYLTMIGYTASPGTASVAGTTSAATPRVVGRIDLTGAIDSTTALSDAFNASNPRSAVSTNGTDLWVSGNGGTRYTTLGSTTSTLLHTTPTNIRVANIYGRQLYISGATTTGPLLGVGTVGTGLPTTAGQTVAELSGFPTASGPSSYDFMFGDTNTLYVADDRTIASGGGLQKWVFNGTSWALAYTLNSGLTAGLRGLTGDVDGSGNVTFYATTADSITASAGNKIVTISEPLAATSNAASFSLITTAPGNTAFRGIELLVPEPAALGLLGLAALFAGRRRG